MSLWNIYFLSKLFLHYRGSLSFSLVWNLAFILLLVLPTPALWKNRPWVNRLRLTCEVLLAFALYWRESYLPALSTALDFSTSDGLEFDPVYIAQLLWGFVDPWACAATAAIAAIIWYCWKARWVRLTPVTALLMLGVLVSTLRAPRGEMDAKLFAFFEKEADRKATFPKRAAEPFDMVFLHFCSFGWDDVAEAANGNNPIVDRFDHVFTRFNSVTSYSGPATIRLMRSRCGQTTHASLYEPIQEDCSLFGSLQNLGYKNYTLLNFSANTMQFHTTLADNGATPPLSTKDLPPELISYGKFEIASNYASLDRWLSVRKKSPEDRAAVYFNSLTFHSGNHHDEAGWWKTPRKDIFAHSVEKVAEDLDRIYAKLEASGRRTVVFLIPEHGMALRGTKIQAPDMRDIPLPQITNVPFGVKFIGPGAKREAQKVYSQPVSYLALAHLVSRFITTPPFALPSERLAKMMDSVPQTPFVAENATAAVLALKNEYYLKDKSGTWRQLPPDIAWLPADTRPASRIIAGASR
jgi:hypothetical protein